MTVPAKLIGDIINGKYDDGLDRLREAIRTRKEALDDSVYESLKPGDRVRLSNTTHPAYMRGITGTVTRHLRRNVEIRLDEEGRGRFRGSSILRVSPSIIEKVK